MFPEWEALAYAAEDTTLITFLQYGFPVGYEGPVPTPADHISILPQHPRDVANYVLTEIEEEVMLGPFDMEPFIPWCQVNALLTQPKEGYLSEESNHGPFLATSPGCQSQCLYP